MKFIRRPSKEKFSPSVTFTSFSTSLHTSSLLEADADPSANLFHDALSYVGLGCDKELYVLFEDEEYFFNLDELKTELTFIHSYLAKHSAVIEKSGIPPSDLEGASWLRRNLFPLYPNTEILSASERKKLRQTDRKKLLQFKLDILSILVEALDTKDPELVWQKCEPILFRTVQGDDARFYLELDRFYLGLGLRESMRNNNWIAHSGGLTDVLEVIWHVTRELIFGTYDKVRQALPSGFFKVTDGKLKFSQPTPFALAHAAMSLHYKFALQSGIRVVDPEFTNLEYRQSWGSFVCWIHDCLDLEAPGLTSDALAFGYDVKLVFDTSENILKIIRDKKFAPSHSYQRILFQGKILDLTKGEAHVIKVLNEDKKIQENLIDGWATEDDILDALKKHKFVANTKDTLRDTLTFRSKEGSKKKREPRQALAEKLLLHREPAGVPQYRLNLETSRRAKIPA